MTRSVFSGSFARSDANYLLIDLHHRSSLPKDPFLLFLHLPRVFSDGTILFPYCAMAVRELFDWFRDIEILLFSASLLIRTAQDFSFLSVSLLAGLLCLLKIHLSPTFS